MLPPVFLTASLNDTDIPFSVSQYMSIHIQNATFEPICGNDHDFDRDVSTGIGLDIYKKAINWLSHLANCSGFT